MLNGAGPTGAGTYQRRLAIRRGDVESELDPEATSRVDDRVDLRIVLGGLQFGDPRLGDA